MTQARAISYALAAFFLWVVVDAAIKLGGQAALSPFMIMGVLGVVGVIGNVGGAVARGRAAALRPFNLRAQAAVCFCALLINYFCVIALRHLPLTIYYIVIFVQPLAMALLVSLLKHETLTPVKIACVVAGFVGVIVAVAPRGGAGGEWIGYLAALTNVAGFVVYSLIIRRIARTDSPESIQLCTASAVGLFGVVGAVLETAPVPDGKAFAMMVVAGILNLLGNLLYNKALHHTSSTNVAQTHYTQIISGAVIGYALWHEVPTWNLALGSVIIIVSGAIVAARAHSEAG